MAVPLLSAVEPPKRLIADKAYDVDSLRNWLKARRIKAVIPSTATRTVPYPLDRVAYRRRNLIERLFGASRTGDASPPATTASPETTSQPSPSLPSQPSGPE
jgi:transposase